MHYLYHACLKLILFGIKVMSSIKSFLILIHSIIFLFFFSGCSGHNNLEPKISIEILELEKKHQKQILIQEMIASSRTLHKVSWPILKNNTDSCINLYQLVLR